MSEVRDTVRRPVDVEIEISRSRFLTRLERVADEESAREVIAAARAAHPKARHHCSAFVLGFDGRTRRSNDDGEPSGTAGAPMLDALVSAGLGDVVAVVTRYFGGILLGAGGLTRAYRAAVAEAVAAAERLPRGVRLPVEVEAGYDLAPQLEAEARRLGIALGEAGYGERVLLRLLPAEDQLVPLRSAIAELSAGSLEPLVGVPLVVDLPG